MKKYVTPSIRIVKLDAKQAILAVCMQGGVYLFTEPVSLLKCASTGPVPGVCAQTPKGGTVSVSGDGSSSGAAPS